MSELEYRCTHCGQVGEIEEETSEYFICGCCGAKVIKKRSEELIANIKKLSLEREAYELANYRKLLRKSLENKNIEFQNDIATKILSLIPTDFEASFYSKFINRIKYPRDYVSFLNQIYQDYTLSEVEPLFDFIISNARHDEEAAINNIFNKLGFDNSYLEKIEKRKRDIEKELDLYANIERDVFICHSSKDSKLLQKIVNEIEENNGYHTWYSERNMPWDPINYWDNIKEAIKNSKVFLILITENSKFSPDVKKELSFAKELGKDLRVGYLGEETNPGIEINRFLRDTESKLIKYSDIDSLNSLTETVYDLIENSKNNKIEIETKPIIENKQVVKEEPVRQESNESENNELSKNIKRAFLFLEDEEWDKADQRLELILDNDPTNGEAYLGKLLLEAKCNSIESLIKVDIDLASLKNYNKVIRFGDKDLKQKLEDIVTKQALLKAKLAEQKRKEEKVKAEQEALRKKQEEEKRLEEERQRKLQEEKKAAELKKIEELNKALEEQKRLAELKEQEEKRQAELKAQEEKKRLEEERQRIEKEEQEEEKRRILEKEKEIEELHKRPYQENGITYIDLGKFPQTHVSDSRIILKLNKMTSTNSNGYYELDGSEYCKINATPYENKYQYSDRDSVQSGNVWFKVKPIKWRVLEQKGDKCTVISEYLLVAKRFDDWRNNYISSEIRAYLIDDFYSKAFTTKEKSFIQSNTNVNNDNVWLLSKKEVCNTTYGFKSDASNYDTNRKSKPTDYALATGADFNSYNDAGYWWLRTPRSGYSGSECNVYSNGNAYYSDHVGNTTLCARPAIIINTSIKNTTNKVISTDVPKANKVDFDDLKEKGIQFSQEGSVLFMTLGDYPQTRETNDSARSSIKSKNTKNNRGYIEYKGNEYEVISTKRNSDATHVYYADGATVRNEVRECFKIEPIKWRIIDNNNGVYTLLSDRLLECSQYEELYVKKNKLNNSFYNQAFNDYDKSLIIPNDNNFVSIPSLDDLNTKASLGTEMKRRGIATDYCLASGANYSNRTSTSDYWLYSDNRTNGVGTVINYLGKTIDSSKSDGYICYRPLIYVKCDAIDEYVKVNNITYLKNKK